MKLLTTVSYYILANLSQITPIAIYICNILILNSKIAVILQISLFFFSSYWLELSTSITSVTILIFKEYRILWCSYTKFWKKSGKFVATSLQYLRNSETNRTKLNGSLIIYIDFKNTSVSRATCCTTKQKVSELYS